MKSKHSLSNKKQRKRGTLAPAPKYKHYLILPVVLAEEHNIYLTSRKQHITMRSVSCVLLGFPFYPRRSVTNLQVPAAHSEEINFTAKKGSWTAAPLARRMMNVDGAGETSLRIQTVPSVCLSVSLAGNKPATYTKELFCLRRFSLN